MTANERRKRILEVLCLRRSDTRENLANEFGVSSRTIERDVVTLSLEYPVYTLQGTGGGIYVEKWCRQNVKYLSDEQTGLLEELLLKLEGRKAEIMRSILTAFYPQRRRV